jgi:Na+-transporting methylmalonyl-CoA/oxaloacetate decarboxylase gamma subunit
MYVLGFPGGADIGGDSAQSGYLQATFSPGVVTALKDSIKGDFKVIQSDTKISGGSSGSPAFDELGRVFGIVTYESAAAEGDNFSFAIPAQTALSIINTKDIHLEPGLLYNHFLKGIELSKKNHCLEAIKEFEDSEKINSKFRYDDNFLASYIDSCKSIQSQGLSIDNEWDQLILNLKSIKTTLIYVAIGLCIIFLFIFVIVVLVRRMKKDEIQLEQFTRRESVKVDQQENILSHQLKQITEVSDPETTIVTQNSVPVSAPVSEHKIQDIVDLIHRQKQAGIQGGPLVLYLRKAGYADSEIQEAFNQINKIY